MLIFVYGTLKENFTNFHIIETFIIDNSIIKVNTTHKYPMYQSRYYFPYLEDRKGGGNIIEGELIDVRPEAMDELDLFEGVPDLYKRGEIEVEIENEKFTVPTYFKAQNTDRLENLISEFLG